ncbi:hypothetical protein CGC48_08515 [Capnocytophaga cynodegmi]|uniref:Transmembrane protein n=1 Tax=Capnocytophaga cynodegmi TaxID=28189 RepID=A0A250EA98_9FLAO|nr:hypothetical protein [Capnocytophaga cynodegmi]ATA68665.1 hypothetical protein CGC48_08515 [Capnocytophaga cynodegmi]
MENNKKEKKYVLRRFFMYCHLFIAILALLVEFANDFRGLKLILYSRNFTDNFVVKKYYYVGNNSYRKSTSSYVYGFLEGDTKYNQNNTRSFLMNRYNIGRNFKEDEQGETFLEVWYCPKLDYVVSFANQIKSRPTFYDEFLSYTLFIIWIIPEIWYLVILRRRERREKLLEKNNSNLTC